ncbi:sensor domain-containing protein [Actinacidiphila rubida]|uniref:PknH-like extracellular domain-containing protein n=1 Tax=Actinacidiphila rubida TaxID=310780 RepID=A0A1H8DUH4_9ACTN|nr:sensor domain-containing protein [Actinacidiphila rubida]SEN10870.1 PknH-like extracellular domain-containing protein [Actinacidiphila rubida]
MRIRARSRLLAGSGRTAAVAAALLPALALTAACGGGGGKSGASDTGTPQNVRASGAVSTVNLTQALLTSKDVSDVQVLPAGSKEQLLGPRQLTDAPACQPVADQWSSQPAHPRQVYAGAMVTDTAAQDKKAKTISLSVVASYKAGEAKAVLDDLTAALKTCTSYNTTRNGTATTFTVHAVAPGGGYGDQQVAYTIGDKAKGTAGQVLVTVIRVGDTTAAYETLRTDHTPATLRAAIPQKQVAKLREAAKPN